MELTKEYIVNLLRTNDEAIVRALIALHDRQTAMEQASLTTRENNGRGFSAFDAEVGTSMVKSYRTHGRMTPRMISVWKKQNKFGKMRIEKYANQLLEIAKEKMGVK